MLVLDTSAALAVLASRHPEPALVERLAGDGELQAPHLIDVELLNALRGLVAGGGLSEDRAADVRDDFADLSIVRCGHELLADRMWELRHNLTAYDAAFVALAEALGVPLVTCDARLAASPGHDAHVELFPA